METGLSEIGSTKMFDGFNKRYKHYSPTLGCSMTFSVYFPPSSSSSGKFPVKDVKSHIHSRCTCRICGDSIRTTPGTVSNKAWWAATEERFQAWPRTAGPPVVMNPISRQNFIVKSRSE
ncbi:unnamed protein product [Arabis nemorensis]|uniref:Uncharacterized protein n=1 Tax=Arabis nemorensis TaxID=586526 RepID=A0A565BPY0_9BRAS|nr:unnamed protein product [Arabis nemorensis]